MTEMSLYKATIDGKEVVGLHTGDIFYGIDEKGKLYGNNNVTNLTPVRVVPKDAVVIEGISEEKFVEDMNVLLSRTPYDDFIRRSFVRDVLKQLTPPRPEEPKGFGAIVEAEVTYFGHKESVRKRFVRIGDLWFDEFNNQSHKWSDLKNPVIISEGVE